MANLATVRAFRCNRLRGQWVEVFGAVYSGRRRSPRIGSGLGDILETLSAPEPASMFGPGWWAGHAREIADTRFGISAQPKGHMLRRIA